MGEFYKTCDIHGKPFPANQVDTRKTKMVKVYIEKKQEIEGKEVNLTLFVDKQAENEGIDVCALCMQEKVDNLLKATDNVPAFKGVYWNKVIMQKKDGSGTYEKNVKEVLSQEEIAEKIKIEKNDAKQVAPPIKA